MAGKYQIEVGAKLNTEELNKDLSSWSQKQSKTIIDLDTGEAQKKIKTLTDGMGNIATVVKKGNQEIATITDSTKKWAEQQDQLKSRLNVSSTQLERMKVTAEGMTGAWTQNASGMQNIISRISQLQNQYSSLISSSESLDSTEVRRLNNQQREIQESIALMRQQTSATDETSVSVASLATQFISVQKAIDLMLDTIKAVIDEVFKLDASLTELAKVTNMTKDEMGGVTERAFELGEEIGRTGREVLDSVGTFSQAGYSMQEAFDLGETALVMTNIADGITDVEQASTNLISIMKGFNLTVNDSEHIIDSFNAVSNNMAASYKNLADVMQRSSATLASGGTSLEQGIGLATAALEVLGDKPEQVGRALNSLTQRLRGNLCYAPYVQKCA